MVRLLFLFKISLFFFFIIALTVVSKGAPLSSPCGTCDTGDIEIVVSDNTSSDLKIYHLTEPDGMYIIPDNSSSSTCSTYGLTYTIITTSHNYSEGGLPPPAGYDLWSVVTVETVSNSRTVECQTCTLPDIEPIVPENNSTHIWLLLDSSNCRSVDFSIPDHNYTSSGRNNCCDFTDYYSLTIIDDNSTEPSTCPDGQSLDSNGTCGLDTDNDGVPDIEDPDIDGDGIPNDQDSTPNGEGSSDDNSTSSCPINSHIDGVDGACTCNVGFHNIALSGTLSCVADETAVCPSSHPSTGKPLVIANVSEFNCMAMIDSNINDGGTGGNYLPLPSPSTVGCCYYVSTNPTSDNNSSDPCYYPSHDASGYPAKETTYFQSNCTTNIITFGGGAGSYIKNPDCSYGTCYYEFSDTSSNDSNTTSISSSNDTDTGVSSAIDNSIGELGAQLSNDNEQILDALSDIGKNEDGSYGASFTPNDTEISNFTIDNEKVSTINNKVSEYTSSLSSAKDLFESSLSQFSTFSDNVTTSFNGLVTDFDTYKNMFSSSPDVVVTSGGSCSGLSFTVLGKHVDLSSGMCSSFSKISPIVHFLMVVITQFIVIFLSVKLLSKDN